jgi:hypothetical protein
MIVKDVLKLRARYMQTIQFKIDVVSLLPTDVMYFAFGTGWAVIFRLNRLLRMGRFLKVIISAASFRSHLSSARRCEIFRMRIDSKCTYSYYDMCISE